MVAPLIMAGNSVAASNVIDATYTTVMDLAPTFIEIANATYPEDNTVMPMLGESMSKFLSGESVSVHNSQYVTILSHRGRAFLRKDKWKIATTFGPFDEANFELYNVVSDPGETANLAIAEPEIYAELIGIWRKKRKEVGIIIPSDL